jgi:hypothetical protein
MCIQSVAYSDLGQPAQTSCTAWSIWYYENKINISVPEGMILGESAKLRHATIVNGYRSGQNLLENTSLHAGLSVCKQASFPPHFTRNLSEPSLREGGPLRM